MFNKSKTNNVNQQPSINTAPAVEEVKVETVEEEVSEQLAAPAPVAPTPTTTTPARSSMMDMISTTATKPSILSEGFSFRGEIAAKGAIHVEGALNGQIQVDELTIGARGNWNTQVAVSPSGSHVIGNPAAATKLTEYVSYTCPHCAEFDRQAVDHLHLGIAGANGAETAQHARYLGLVDVLEAQLLQGGDDFCLGAKALFFQQGFKGLGQFFLLVVVFHLGLTNEGGDRLSRSGGRYEQRCYFAFICLFWQGSGACSAY